MYDCRYVLDMGDVNRATADDGRATETGEGVSRSAVISDAGEYATGAAEVVQATIRSPGGVDR